MAESQKEDSSSVKSKQKKSLLDLDFGKDDFLTSWKSMSITEDNAMDLDFEPVSKGKKNTFNFDKTDMDFNLDGDFGKVPSFNLDIPDIDISPLKKNGKPKGRSSEESGSGNTQGKADRFEFTFDFGELEGFNFKPSSKKENTKVNKGENKEDSSKRRVPQKSRDCVAEEVDAHERGKSRSLAASGDLIASNLDSQVISGGSPNSSNENTFSKSGTNHGSLLNSMAAIDEAASHEATIMLEKTSSTSKKEINCQQDKSISSEPLSHEICLADATVQDESVHTVLRDESKQDTILDIEEEVSSRNARESNRHVASFKKDYRGSEVCTDNQGFIANKEGAVPPLGGSHVEEILLADASREPVSCNQMTVKNQELLELSSNPLNSRATLDNLMPENKRETASRSKYFKQPDKAESRFESASNQTKLSSMHDRLIGIRQPCPLEESQNCNSIEAKSDNTVAGISPSSSGELIGKERCRIGTQENSKCLKTNSSCIDTSSLSGMTNKSASQNSANLASLVMNVETKSRKGTAAEGDNVSSAKAIKQVPTLSSLTIRSSLQSSVNPASLAMNVEASHSRKDTSAEGDKASSSKATKQIPTLSGLTISRTPGTNLDSSKSAPQKEITLPTDKQQFKFLAGREPSHTAKVVETRNQTPGIPSLKRKIVEASGADVILKPSKRLSESPINENSAETGKLVDKEVYGNGNVVDGRSISAYGNEQTYRLDVPGHMNGLDVLFSVESDSNIKNAEACAKGLEDICNMLRKKHEEAKELLVRAIVTNNKLLVLNHPIYEEKIRMVQKFAMQLSTRELHTPT